MNERVQLVALALLVAGCRPVVGPLPLDAERALDAGAPTADASDAGPQCRMLPAEWLDDLEAACAEPPAPTVPATEHIDVDRIDDCDDDGLADPEDPCPGVPGLECNTADCERFARGEPNLADADLRGCVGTARFTMPPSLDRANLGCARLGIEWAGVRHVLSVDGIQMARSVVTFDSPASDLVVSLDGARVTASRIETRGGTQLRVAPSSRIIQSELRLAGASREAAIEWNVDDDRSFAVVIEGEVARSRVDARVGAGVLVRRGFVDSCLLRSSHVAAVSTQMFGGSIQASYFSVSGSVLARTTLEFGEATVAGSHLRQVGFVRCGRATLIASSLTETTLPSCVQRPIEVRGGQVVAGYVAGTAEFDEVDFLRTVIGPRADATIAGGTGAGLGFCRGSLARLAQVEIECPLCAPEALRAGSEACRVELPKRPTHCARVLELPCGGPGGSDD